MARAAYTGESSWAERQRPAIDDDAEQMKVLSALLGCLIVAEQTDCERSISAALFDAENAPYAKARTRNRS
jgi:hypothetical protein